MIKRLSKKVIAIFLSVCTLISTMALSVPVVSAADNKSDSSVNYISEICVSNSTNESYAKQVITDNGYTLVNHNFNEKSKYYIYVGYKTTNNVEDALTGLVFSNDAKQSINYRGRTYNIVSAAVPPGATALPGGPGTVNFNSDSGQKPQYLYYTKEEDPYGTTEYLTNIDAVGTANSTLDGKEYKTVVSAETGLPQNLNAASDSFDKKPYIYLGYQSQMSPDATYQKLGNENLDSNVKSVNGIDYYNFDTDVEKNDFLVNAISKQYSGNSVVESWAQVLYAMMSIKNEGSGYQNRIEGSSFDDVFGKGQYVDLVAALTNGSGTENSKYDRGLLIQSTGLKQTSNINNVRDEMVNLFTHLVHQHDYNLHNMDDPNEIGKYLVKQDLFDNFQSSSDIIYTLCRVADDKAKPNHLTSASVIGMIFYNFQLVPLIEDGNNPGNDTLNYADVYTNNVVNNSSVKIDKNDTGASVNSSKSFASSVSSSTTNSHASTSGQTYSVTEGMSFSGKVPILKVNTSVNLSSSQAFTFSETNTVTEAFTQTETNTDGLSYTIPPYSIAAINCTSSDETRTQSYDCPIALTYDVAFVASGAELGSSNGFATSFAYKSDYYATFGGEGVSAVNALNNLYKTNGSDTSNFAVKCSGQQNFSKYSSEEWNKILNKTIASNEFPSTAKDTIKFITSKQPMSFLGGQFASDISAVSYSFDKYYALYPIDKIKIYKTKPASSAQSLVQHIDLDSDGSYRLQDYYNTISAFDEHNSDWTNWDPTQGYWALITDDPSTGEEKIIKITSDPVSDGIVSAYKDSKTGLIYINPLKSGKSYIRYVINDNVFQYYPNVPGDATEFSTLNLKYVTNDDITAKGTIEINTSNIEHNYDENGFCTNCGAYQPAYLNSDGVYEIGNAGQLYWFASLVNGGRTHADFDSQNGAANAVLVKDIVVNDEDMSKLASMQTDSLRKWIPIGTSDNSYTGQFDGRNHTISGIYFSDSTADNVGLFGYTRGGADIYNVGIVNSYIEGKNCVGGILGRNNNSGVNIQHCFSEATVIGNEGVGGIEGSTYGGKIIDCYNAGSVKGAKFVGSIRGRNTNSSGAIDNCFNAGEVIGTGTDNIGGIRGDGNGTISNCYCISTKLTDTAATTKTPEQFASGEVAYLLNNSMTDGKQVWYQNIDNGETPDDYPKFDGGTVYCGDDCIENTYSNYSLSDTGGHKYNNGFCTKCGEYQHAVINSDGYYEIGNAGQLFWFSSLVNGDNKNADFEEQNNGANAVLTADIDLEEREWTPIGIYGHSEYSGKFDGQNHNICGLSITEDLSGKIMTGLFGKVTDGTLENFSVEGNITSSENYTGGIIGYALDGTIVKNISSYVDVKGINFVGGIAGRNDGTIENCCNLGTVSGTGDYVGGITGFNSSKITCCFNSGNISSSDSDIGGIAGKNHSGLSSSASIINCYNTGDISCEGYYKCGGGIVGYNDGATVENCYNSGKIIGSDSKVNGLIGYNVNSSNSIVTNCYYLDTCGASDTFASGKTDEQFASGEVTYLLNNSVTDGSQVWYQNIDNGKTPDDYPKFDGGTVYYLEYKDTYSNTYSEPPKPDAFDEDDDGNLIIKTYDDLVKLSQLVRSDYDVYGSQNYILANNIKASDDSEWTQGIGSIEDNKPFNGTFNGKGYCIVGLNVNSPKYGGLFEIIGENGKVQDLFVYDCDFKVSSDTSGGIAAINNGTIDHCISGINLTSGIVHINSDITIDAVALNSSIKGELSGGIAGENNGLITGSRNAAVVTGAQCGGIAAENNGKIYGCANSVKIGASSSSVSGGLVGRNCGIIESSYNSGTVSGNSEKTTGSIAGINGYEGAENPTVKNVFYTTVNNLNAVGTDSLTKPDETNKAKAKNSDFQSDDFVNELNSVSDDTVTWVRKSKFNKGNPTIKSNFFMYNVISAGNGITIEGSMHEALNIQYNVCNEKDEEYIAITSALDKTSVSGVYSVSLTDNDGNYIPDELWCQGDYKISVPVSGNNVEFAEIDTDGQINYYKPDSVENGIAVFTVSHPMSFAVVDRTSTNKNISDNTSTDKAVINTSNDNTPIQTGSTVCCSVLLIVMFASAFVIVIKRRNNFE